MTHFTRLLKEQLKKKFNNFVRTSLLVVRKAHPRLKGLCMNSLLQTTTGSSNTKSVPTSARQIVPSHDLSVSLQSQVTDWRAFDPDAYLNEYYSDLGEENLSILQFYADVFRSLSPKSIMLDFGSGPTIYSLISAVTKVKEIHIVEYLEANRRELRKWFQEDTTAFNWRHFIRAALQIEKTGSCSAVDILRRTARIRNSVASIGCCDVRQIPPFVRGRQRYDVVASNFCAESITDNHEEWHAFVLNIASLVAVGGTFLITALKKATYYTVGPVFFPAVSLDEEDLVEILREAGFSSHSIVIRSVPADCPSRHYEGLMFAAAVQRGS